MLQRTADDFSGDFACATVDLVDSRPRRPVRSGTPSCTRSRGCGACHQPRVSVALAGRYRVEFAESQRQFARGGTERPWFGTDLAEGADRQQPARGQTPDQFLIEATITELVAQQHLHRRSRRQALVEIDGGESTTVSNSVAQSQISCPLDRHAGYVDTPHMQTAAGQPHRAVSLAAGDVERPSRGGNERDMRLQKAGRCDSGGLRRRRLRVAPVPAAPVLLGHSAKATAAGRRVCRRFAPRLFNPFLDNCLRLRSSAITRIAVRAGQPSGRNCGCHNQERWCAVRWRRLVALTLGFLHWTGV